MFVLLRDQNIRLFEKIEDLSVEELFTKANIESLDRVFSRVTQAQGRPF
jgi:hypothetical protein|tara:strand:+ start:1774 stop:1920 length:147 start_codon:yes stop_codon:yes gene_type:complete